MSLARRRGVQGFAVLALLCIAASYLAFANPFNWGVRKSQHFSEATFDDLRNGEPIAEVVTRLGTPVSIDDRTSFPGVCPQPDCTLYAFTGDPASWAIGHAEYWVIADRQGRVIHKLIHREP